MRRTEQVALVCEHSGQSTGERLVSLTDDMVMQALVVVVNAVLPLAPWRRLQHRKWRAVQ